MRVVATGGDGGEKGRRPYAEGLLAKIYLYKGLALSTYAGGYYVRGGK